MSCEEQQHVVFWKDLLALVEKKLFPQIFNHPADILNELTENFSKIVDLSNQSIIGSSLTGNFVIAFRLEFYLLHPALERLWHFYGIIREGENNPEKEYENHIKEFIDAMRKYGAASIELEALGETIEKLWSNAKDMARDANYDELTNIYNRRGFFNVVTSLAYLSKRNKFNSAILMIDIDHFKRINDTFGHQTGDQVLIEVVNVIKKTIRDSDVLGRFGGEEFLVYLPQIEQEGVFNLAEKIREAIQEQTKDSISVTASIGGGSAIIDGVVEDVIHELINQADKYLYEAKRKGRNQVIC